MSDATLVYSTSTGDAPATSAPATSAPEGSAAAAFDLLDADPHCYVCGRHTDHFAEHDDLVAAGKAVYGKDGSVYNERMMQMLGLAPMTVRA